MGQTDLPDHYGTLEVAREADEQTIKRSYRAKVLLWHPDKHPAQPEVAERRIREINAAYETLSNAQKRQQYDQQLAALEKKANGVRLDTSYIQPRMSIPREFMMCPMGYPEKFIRSAGRSLCVQSREDIDVGFEEFFREAKFSLWWRPQRNNMCHLRSQSSAAQGERGGLCITYSGPSSQSAVSDVHLSPLQEPEAYFVVVASPELQGSFRLESAPSPGRFLAYQPPMQLQVVTEITGALVVDFVFVDYASMFKYMTLEEVLIPVVQKLGGQSKYVFVDAIRDDAKTQTYFRNAGKRSVWTREDFQAYFEGHYQQWDYDAIQQCVRLRTPEERFAQTLRRARTPAEIAAAVALAGPELGHLPFSTLQELLEILKAAPPDGAAVSECVNHLAAQKKLLGAAASIAQGLQPPQLLLLLSSVKDLAGGERINKELAAQRADTLSALHECIQAQLRSQGLQPFILDSAAINGLCGLPLDWGSDIGEATTRELAHRCAAQPLGALLPGLRAACEVAPQDGGLLLELLSSSVKEKILQCSMWSEDVSEAVELLVGRGFCLDCVLPMLRQHGREATASCTAAAIAALGERVSEEAELRELAAMTVEKMKFQGLSKAILLRLAVASTKSAVVADIMLGPVLRLIIPSLRSWGMDDLAKLLLAVANAKSGADASAVAELFRHVGEILPALLPGLSPTQLIKMIMALSKAPGSRDLLATAGREGARRLPELPVQQLLLLTQGLVPLGAADPAVHNVLAHWVELSRSGSSPGGGRSEAQTIPVDVLAKVCQVVAALGEGAIDLFEAIAQRCGSATAGSNASDLSAAGQTALQAAFANSAAPRRFRGRDALLRAAGLEPEAREHGTARSRSRRRGGNDHSSHQARGRSRSAKRRRRDSRSRNRSESPRRRRRR